MQAHVTYTIGDAALIRRGECGIYRGIALAAADAGLVDISDAKLSEALAALLPHPLRAGLTQSLFAAGEDGAGITQASLQKWEKVQ